MMHMHMHMYMYLVAVDHTFLSSPLPLSLSPLPALVTLTFFSLSLASSVLPQPCSSLKCSLSATVRLTTRTGVTWSAPPKRLQGLL